MSQSLRELIFRSGRSSGHNERSENIIATIFALDRDSWISSLVNPQYHQHWEVQILSVTLDEDNTQREHHIVRSHLSEDNTIQAYRTGQRMLSRFSCEQIFSMSITIVDTATGSFKDKALRFRFVNSLRYELHVRNMKEEYRHASIISICLLLWVQDIVTRDSIKTDDKSLTFFVEIVNYLTIVTLTHLKL